MFLLHPTLKKDSFFIKSLVLSDLLLMNESRFPWFILVPRRQNVSEIFDLGLKDQVALWQEIVKTSEWSKKFFSADKMNIAALGNKVPQLHIHIIARLENDPAWPNPVWNSGESIPYTETEQKKRIESILSQIF